MGFVFADSFDHYATADFTKKWTQVVDSTSMTVAAVGRHSSNGLKIVNTSNNAAKGILGLTPSTPAPSGATMVCGLSFVQSSGAFTNLRTDSNAYGSSNSLLAFLQGGTVQGYIRVNSSGTVSYIRGTTVLGTTSSALSAAVTSFIELKTLLHASAGTVEIRFDGITVLSLTGQNTIGASGAAWDEFRLGGISTGTSSSGGSAGTEWDFDDFYLLDGSGSTSKDFLGDVRIDVRLPNAAGDETGWTPDSGSNYARVSETLIDGDTSYVAATTAATKDTYKTAAQAVAGANIFAIQVNMGARKTDAGAAGIKPVIRIGGTDYLGTEQGIPSSYKFLRQIYDLNPATGVAWADGDIGPSATQFGVDKST